MTYQMAFLAKIYALVFIHLIAITVRIVNIKTIIMGVRLISKLLLYFKFSLDQSTIRYVVNWASRKSIFRARCLETSLLEFSLYTIANIRVKFIIGVALSGKANSKTFFSHAWIEAIDSQSKYKGFSYVPMFESRNLK